MTYYYVQMTVLFDDSHHHCKKQAHCSKEFQHDWTEWIFGLSTWLNIDNHRHALIWVITTLSRINGKQSTASPSSCKSLRISEMAFTELLFDILSLMQIELWTKLEKSKNEQKWAEMTLCESIWMSWNKFRTKKTCFDQKHLINTQQMNKLY